MSNEKKRDDADDIRNIHKAYKRVLLWIYAIFACIHCDHIALQFVWVGVINEWILDKRPPTMQTMISVILTLTGVFLAADILSGDITVMPVIGVILGFVQLFPMPGLFL
jgi:hypothetical protein